MGQHSAFQTVTVQTVTIPTSALRYLRAVADGQTKAQGLKRPTLEGLQRAAELLPLPVRIGYRGSGYFVTHSGYCDACRNLADVAVVLLALHKRQELQAQALQEAQEDLALALSVEDLSTEALQEAQEDLALAMASASEPEPAPRPARSLAPLADLGAAPALGPSLPAFVTRPQQQQQPQQGPTAAPLQTGPRARSTAPLGMPEDAARLLQRFDLSLDGLLTAGASSPKLSKGAKIAQAVILHHLPARSLSSAVFGDADARTAPRSRLTGLEALAARNGITSLISRHNGCPWASKGCSAGCLAWAGHGGISTTVAAARARRTMAFVWGHSVYALAVLWAIGRAYAAAQRKGQSLAYRLRGTDDLPWHDLRFNLSTAEAARFARRFGLPAVPGIGTTIPEALSLAAPGTLHPYEYSAAPLQGPLGLLAQRAAGIDVTCSLKADRPGGCAAAADAIAAGFRVAVPVAIAKGQPLPPVLWLKPSNNGPALRLLVVDGDVHDHRWLDPQGPQPEGFEGVAVLLRTKISRGRGAAAAAFSLAPAMHQWQPLAGGGQALLGQL